jgi:LacI family transcriptional regulator
MSDVKSGWDKRSNRVTIREIAARAGVDASTVSRALRRPPGTDPTADRVRAIAEELGYRRDSAAAALRTRQSRALGVLVPRLTDTVLATIYEAIEQKALEMEYQTIVACTYDRLDEQRRRVALMLSRRVDGLILADAHLDCAYVDWVAERDVPFVLVNRRAGDYPAITTEDYLGGKLAGNHLVELGHERVVVLAGLEWSSATTERTAGCVTALREHGIEVLPEHVEPSPLDPRSSCAAMERLLERRPDLTAVFAVDDLTALGAMVALRAAGLHPGVNVAVVGYNDTSVAATVELSTVRSPHETVGALGTRTLLDLIAGHPVESVRLAPELIVRGSSCPAPEAGVRSGRSDGAAG